MFGDDVVIFSDKSCVYPESGDTTLDWTRWFRRAIAASAHQIQQAERWIRANPDKIFLDAKCIRQLPIPMPSSDRIRIHRVCVATGAAHRCLAETARPSLALDLSIRGDAMPLTLGRVDEVSGHLHVLDEASLTSVLNELSTTADFIAYLVAREELVSRGFFQSARAEVDVLAEYLWHNRSFPAVAVPYSLRAGLWEQLLADPTYQAGRRENAVSAFWDGLIEYVTDHYLEGSLEFGNDVEMSQYEALARTMASENRFYRRILSKSVLERADKARERMISSLLPSGQQDVFYVLLIGPGAQSGDYGAYRTARGQELQLRCYAAKVVRPEARIIVGIALDARGLDGGSEDFVFLDTANWTPDDMERAARIRNQQKYFVPGRVIESRMNEDEYPGAH
ncbi:hypothetical protein [Peristeroidobacter soli]|uniref:hypothetical protein n=1 Tax=Peristeroidobacter soli TaxID=2497877 RepID=UPI00101C910D|nr:hypothetical protein [Peristeroidobacter soli]